MHHNSLLPRSALFLLVAAVIAGGFAGAVRAQTAPENGSSTEVILPAGPSREELESKIRERAEALEAVNRQIEETNQNLLATKEQKSTLQREVTTLEKNIGQLELAIESDYIASQKLTLEVDSLRYDIRDIEITINDKTEAIGHLLRELQRAGNTNLLVIFLRNNSLADGVWETQTLKNLRNQLSVDIANLTSLQSQLESKAQIVSDKKTDIETHQRNQTAKKSIVEDQRTTRKVVLSQTKNRESEYERQLAELKEQQDDISDEIAKVEEQLRAAFDVSLLPVKRPGVFAWPVQMVSDGGKGRITQHFGEVSYLYRGKPHNGMDIGAPIGTPVYAAEDGVVTAVDNNDKSTWSKYQYGKYIMVKHPNNLSTLYAHLSKFAVARGESVKRGDLIGYVGSTGYATGPHLHFGVYWSASVLMKSVPPAAGLVPVGVIIEPEDYL